MALIRDWVAPASVTALVAWIVIPTRPAEPVIYDNIAQAHHRACALDGDVMPMPGGRYPREDFAELIPSAGSTMQVVDAHECQGSMQFTHVILQSAAGDKASVLVTRSGEGGERTEQRRLGDFDVTQIRTTRRRAFVVIDHDRARELQKWRNATIERMRQFLRQSEVG